MSFQARLSRIKRPFAFFLKIDLTLVKMGRRSTSGHGLLADNKHGQLADNTRSTSGQCYVKRTEGQTADICQIMLKYKYL